MCTPAGQLVVSESTLNECREEIDKIAQLIEPLSIHPSSRGSSLLLMRTPWRLIDSNTLARILCNECLLTNDLYRFTSNEAIVDMGRLV